MNLKSIKKILLFGKSRAFSEDEFMAQLKAHKIELTREYSEDVSLIVDGRMMKPSEQQYSDALYEEKGLQSVSIDLLERALAASMDASTLLMSLKLSGDKKRLKSFIENSMIPDALFFKLIKMYSWSGEDFFENDDNRDVSAAFISRFYENIERNHNVQYATTGFIHLVNQAKSSELLNAIYELEPMNFHPKIQMAIAMSSYIDAAMQERLFKNGTPFLHEALSFNKELKLSLVQELISEVVFGENMAKSIVLDDEKFMLLRDFDVDLALNETLTLEMQQKLLALEKDDVKLSLASNNSLHSSLIESLLNEKDIKLQERLHQNSAMPVALLEAAYKNGIYHLELAKNESTPIEILYQLQLDSRYERAVKTNASFGKHIQSENIGWL